MTDGLTKTTFVLGAGSSAAYRFPVGSELTSRVVASLPTSWRDTAAKEKLVTTLGRLGHDLEKIVEFRRHLEGSGSYSIDIFLQNRPEFSEIGKFCIAWHILEAEWESNLHEGWRPDAEDWYRYFFNRLLPHPFSNLADHAISFLTFNYDRSFQYSLLRSAYYAYGKDEQAVLAAVRKIPVVHIHGSVGRLPGLGASEGETFLNFGAADPTDDNYWDLVRRAARNLRLMHEESDSGYTDAAKILMESDRIHFLGFAYHRSNLVALLEAMRNQGYEGSTLRSASGTAWEMSDRELDFARSLSITAYQKSKVLDFVRDRVELDDSLAS